jgi:hypothetical protein
MMPGITVSVGEGVWEASGLAVPVLVSDGEGLAAAELEVEYDPERLSLDMTALATPGGMVPAGFELYANAAEPGRIKIVLVPPIQSPVPTLVGGPGTLLSLRVVPPEGAARADVRILRAEFSDNRGRRVLTRVAP